ncbi:MAG TPA: hypothetical protein VLT33_10640 [Labilithrix sp.]|nr:hypothetical protein [Labilithrix sp.]
MRLLSVVRGTAIGAMVACASVLGAARAQGPAPSASASAGTADAGGGEVSGCVESVPKGAQRPVVTDAFPLHGTSGWAASLSITVRHGKGEHVFRAGLDLGGATEAKKYLRKAGFTIPDQDGGAAAQLWTEPDDKDKPQSVTHLELPLVILPEKPGRSTMELPPLPIAVARANGEVVTLCTHSHVIQVEDPTANTPQAAPKLNPPPRPQREEWTALKKALLWGSLGLVAGALLAYFGYRQAKKPKPVPPPPPPRPPWEIALERLDEVRHAGLLDAKRHAEYFDRVSDAVRGYLGARFGFDGLESTSDEILTALRKQAGGFVRLETTSADTTAPSPGVPIDDIRRFLGDCDLVKFANLKPVPEQCSSALVLGEHIVRATMPFSSSQRGGEASGLRPQASGAGEKRRASGLGPRAAGASESESASESETEPPVDVSPKEPGGDA